MADSQPLLTRAEATGYEETSRHSDVLAFCEALAAESELVHRSSFGQSGEGQDLVYLVISGDRCFSPERAAKLGKVVVLVEANIHAGEVEGKEMILALARDLVRGELGKTGDRILREVCLLVVPNFNPDGNDRISPKHRALDLANLEGQVNPPGGVGTRYTGQGWNLNRDNTKQEAIETRSLATLYQTWWPHLFIDCHTTDGSIHAFDLTFDTSRNNDALFPELRRDNRTLLEKVARRVARKHGVSSYWYGNYAIEDDPHSGWHTYPALPRFGSHYRGLLGRFDVLLETYSYLSFRRRCEVIRAWLHELLRYAAKHSRELRERCDEEQRRIIARGTSYDPRQRVGIQYGVARRGADGALLFDYPAHALDDDTAIIEAYDEASVRAHKVPGDQDVTYHVPHLRSFVPVLEVTTPPAYLAPAELAARLRGHGLQFEVLSEARTFAVESYRVVKREQTFSPDVAALVPAPGETEIPLSAKPPPTRFETVLTVAPERREHQAPAGALWVPTAQRAGTLAVMLLEPHSEDGFARWQFFDDQLVEGELFPVHRVTGLAQSPRKSE